MPNGLLGGFGDSVDSTLGAIGSLSNPYGTPSHDEWQINSAKFKLQDGSGQEILFFASKSSEDSPGNRTGLDNVTDSGGRRIVIYDYPYRDGQATDDLGRRGEKYSFNLKFFGPRYRDRYMEFYRKAIERRTTGILTHPSIGDKLVRLMDYEFIHSHAEFNAVSLRCTFVEDNTLSTQDNFPGADKINAIDSLIRNALGIMTSVNRVVGNGIFSVGALLLLPNAIQNAMKLRLASIMNAHARLLGQIAATFGTDGSVINLASSSGGINNSNSGVSSTTNQTLAPVFQVGLPPDQAAAVQANQSAFVSANQITATQLIFNVNQSRSEVAEAIAFHESNMGSDSFDIVLAYRQLVVAFQKSAEACIKSTALQTVQYQLPYSMTLTEVAYLNGLNPDRMVDIDRLNPGLPSANFVEAGSVLLVPAS